MNWVSYGPDALLVQFAERIGEEAFARSRALVVELETHRPPGLVEFVPGFTSILLEFDPHAVPAARQIAPALIERLEAATRVDIEPAPLKEIRVTYDGPDLERVAQAHDLSPEELCRLHSEPIYKVYLLGFSPGFPYLGDLNPRLHTPRLSSPRPRVPAGSIGIGGEHTGIYTVEGPGGWNIIGHTNEKVFDPDRRNRGEDEAMFLLKQGDRVKFVPIR